MSIKTETKKHPNWGGKRPGAGRPATGVNKAKVSLNVSKEQWEEAIKKWKGKPSHLVDKLICEYAGKSG